MKKVYLAYIIMDDAEKIKVFKKEVDAENYIREQSKKLMVNRDDLGFFENRDFCSRLYIDIIYLNEDNPSWSKYATFYVVEKDLN